MELDGERRHCSHFAAASHPWTGEHCPVLSSLTSVTHTSTDQVRSAHNHGAPSDTGDYLYGSAYSVPQAPGCNQIAPRERASVAEGGPARPRPSHGVRFRSTTIANDERVGNLYGESFHFAL